ncbi:hypothetical protein GNI_023170, partial [Gregarina niphandrodes]
MVSEANKGVYGVDGIRSGNEPRTGGQRKGVVFDFIQRQLQTLSSEWSHTRLGIDLGTFGHLRFNQKYDASWNSIYQLYACLHSYRLSDDLLLKQFAERVTDIFRHKLNESGLLLCLPEVIIDILTGQTIAAERKAEDGFDEDNEWELQYIFFTFQIYLGKKEGLEPDQLAPHVAQLERFYYRHLKGALDGRQMDDPRGLDPMRFGASSGIHFKVGSWGANSPVNSPRNSPTNSPTNSPANSPVNARGRSILPDPVTYLLVGHDEAKVKHTFKRDWNRYKWERSSVTILNYPHKNKKNLSKSDYRFQANSGSGEFGVQNHDAGFSGVGYPGNAAAYGGTDEAEFLPSKNNSGRKAQNEQLSVLSLYDVAMNCCKLGYYFIFNKVADVQLMFCPGYDVYLHDLMRLIVTENLVTEPKDSNRKRTIPQSVTPPQTMLKNPGFMSQVLRRYLILRDDHNVVSSDATLLAKELGLSSGAGDTGTMSINGTIVDETAARYIEFTGEGGVFSDRVNTGDGLFYSVLLSFLCGETATTSKLVNEYRVHTNFPKRIERDSDTIASFEYIGIVPICPWATNHRRRGSASATEAKPPRWPNSPSHSGPLKGLMQSAFGVPPKRVPADVQQCADNGQRKVIPYRAHIEHVQPSGWKVILLIALFLYISEVHDRYAGSDSLEGHDIRGHDVGSGFLALGGSRTAPDIFKIVNGQDELYILLRRWINAERNQIVKNILNLINTLYLISRKDFEAATPSSLQLKDSYLPALDGLLLYWFNTAVLCKRPKGFCSCPYNGLTLWPDNGGVDYSYRLGSYNGPGNYKGSKVVRDSAEKFEVQCRSNFPLMAWLCRIKVILIGRQLQCMLKEIEKDEFGISLMPVDRRVVPDHRVPLDQRGRAIDLGVQKFELLGEEYINLKAQNIDEDVFDLDLWFRCLIYLSKTAESKSLFKKYEKKLCNDTKFLHAFRNGQLSTCLQLQGYDLSSINPVGNNRSIGCKGLRIKELLVDLFNYLNRDEDLIVLCNDILSRYPQHIKAHFLAADSYLKLNQASLAEKHYYAAISQLNSLRAT